MDLQISGANHNSELLTKVLDLVFTESKPIGWINNSGVLAFLNCLSERHMNMLPFDLIPEFLQVLITTWSTLLLNSADFETSKGGESRGEVSSIQMLLL
jgi:hypothetical protein